MLSLTRIFLHNWLRFNAQVIDVEDGLYLAGQDHDGLAALDAIQLVLVADPALVQFGRHPRGGFTYDVDAYARGRLNETQWLRPGNTVSYTVLEFTDRRGGKLTLGVCIETGSHRPVEQTFFILPEALNPGVFVTTGRPLPRIELRALLRDRRGAKHFEHALDYQTELLNQLGGLDERFFHLFSRALRFEPIQDIDEFVGTWLLAERPLDLTPLRRARERLGPLQTEVERIEKRIAGLQTVLEHQADARRLALQRDQHTTLAALLRVAAAAKQIESVQAQLAQTQTQIKITNTQYTDSQAAIAEAESKLRDVERLMFEAGQARRRSELQLQLAAEAREADELRVRWLALRRNLMSAADSLRPLIGKLDGDSPLRVWLDGVAATLPDGPPAPALSQATEEAASHLEAASVRINEMRVRLVEQVNAWRARSESLHQELAGLRDHHQIPYPANIVKLLEVVAPVIGRRPPLLCELLEIPDPKWQDAVEAMLGPRRFGAIVSLTWLEDAQGALNKAGLTDAGLLDLAGADKDARPAQPGSLAEQVTTEYPDLRDYVNAMLGDIITCAAVETLRDHRRAITPEVKVYSDWLIRDLPREHYQPWFIGSRAAQSQVEVRERELKEVSGRLAGLEKQLSEAEALLKALEHRRQLPALRARLEAPLDERPARARANAWQAELQTLDLTPIVEFENQAKGLRDDMARQSKTRDDISHRLAGHELELRGRQAGLEAIKKIHAELEHQAAVSQAQFPEAVAGAEELGPQFLKQENLDEAVRSAEQKEREFETKAREARQRLTETATVYNLTFQFVARPSDPAEARYAEEHKRLTASDLPRYQAQIADTEHDIEEELGDHVLRQLRGHLANAEQALERINDTLADLPQDGKTYRFVYEPAPDFKEFYELIADSGQVEGALFESRFYRDHQAAFSKFYEALTSQTDAGLMDYRRYLRPLIEVKSGPGQIRRLDANTGDDTEIVFYLTLAASFTQLYRLTGREGRPIIRLVALGDAFAKMAVEHIGPVLELFRQCKLQLLAAAQLERCEYLIPHTPTSIVLTSVGNAVLSEPYRNYEARLDLSDEK